MLRAGTGTFGRVRLARVKDDVAAKLPSELLDDPRATSKAGSSPLPNVYALKIMKKLEVVRLKQVEHIKNEKEVLQSISHPFLVTLFAVAQDRKSLYMLLEFIIGGELFTHLRTAGKFENDHGRFYAAQITLGLQYLHEEAAEQPIVYRDLKPENLLIDQQGYIKVTDFGFAKAIDERTWTLCGTPEYLAPEIIQSKGHGKAVDWWAVGVLIFEMLAGYPPFYDENPFGIYQLILGGKIEFPRFVETHARDMVRKLLTADRTKRLGNLKDGGNDVRKHKWFRGLDFVALFNKTLEAPFVPEVEKEDDTKNFETYPESDGGDQGSLLTTEADAEVRAAPRRRPCALAQLAQATIRPRSHSLPSTKLTRTQYPSCRAAVFCRFLGPRPRTYCVGLAPSAPPARFVSRGEHQLSFLQRRVLMGPHVCARVGRRPSAHSSAPARHGTAIAMRSAHERELQYTTVVW